MVEDGARRQGGAEPRQRRVRRRCATAPTSPTSSAPTSSCRSTPMPIRAVGVGRGRDLLPLLRGLRQRRAAGGGDRERRGPAREPRLAPARRRAQEHPLGPGPVRVPAGVELPGRDGAGLDDASRSAWSIAGVKQAGLLRAGRRRHAGHPDRDRLPDQSARKSGSWPRRSTARRSRAPSTPGSPSTSAATTSACAPRRPSRPRAGRPDERIHLRATTAGGRTSSGRSRSPATISAIPRARCSSSSATPRCICTASLEEKVPPFLKGQGQGLGHRGVRDAAALHQYAHGARARAARAGARRRSSGWSAARCARWSRWPSSASARCGWTATSSRPTAARAPPRSPAPSWRWPTRIGSAA